MYCIKYLEHWMKWNKRKKRIGTFKCILQKPVDKRTVKYTI